MFRNYRLTSSPSRNQCKLKNNRFTTQSTFKVSVQLSEQQLQTNMEIYQWRNQTQLPILKAKLIPKNQKIESINLFGSSKFGKNFISSKQLRSTTNYVQKNCRYIVHVEKFNSLYTLSCLSTYDFLKIIRCSLIGYEKIFEKFGACKISSKMIGFNFNKEVKVWTYEQLHLNKYQPTFQKQGEFLTSVIQVCQPYAQSQMSRYIACQIKYSLSFSTALKRMSQLLGTKIQTTKPQFLKNDGFKKSITCKQQSNESTLDHPSFNSIRNKTVQKQCSLKDSPRKNLRKSQLAMSLKKDDLFMSNKYTKDEMKDKSKNINWKYKEKQRLNDEDEEKELQDYHKNNILSKNGWNQNSKWNKNLFEMLNMPAITNSAGDENSQNSIQLLNQDIIGLTKLNSVCKSTSLCLIPNANQSFQS